MELTLDRCETECLHPEKVSPLVGKLLRPREAEQLSATFALLADPTRSRILHALSLADELCVCDLALLVGISQSAMSHQLRLLRTEGVIARRKAGRIVYYALADAHIRHVFADALRHTREEGAAKAEAS
jgi:ArsR family transcriptional regulator, lead/cadmium/zinc/bismuth-responsive transcriptional repressor